MSRYDELKGEYEYYDDEYYDDESNMRDNNSGEYLAVDNDGWVICFDTKEDAERFMWRTLPSLRNSEMEEFVAGAKSTENFGKHVGAMGSCRCGFCEVTEAVLQDNTEKTFRNAKAQALAFLNKKHDRNAFCCGEIEIEFI